MKEEQRKRMKQKFADAGERSALNKHAVSGRSEQLCPSCKFPMKPLYDKMACFKCMTHTP